MFNIILNLFITLIMYLFIPTVFIIIGKPYEKRHLKWIVIINGIVVYLIFAYLHTCFSSNESPNMVATIIWSYVAYRLLKRRCLKNTLLTQSVIIPVFSHIPANSTLDSLDDLIVDTEEITEELSKTGTYFALKISDNSMSPRFNIGDVVIFRQQETAHSEDYVIMTDNSSFATCKQLKKYENAFHFLSINPDYEPMIFSNQEIEEKPVRIIGKVVELRAKF